MAEPVTVRDAAKRLGVTRQRVFALVTKGRIRIVNRAAQGRSAGRFVAGGMLLLAEDVEREAERRGV